MIEGFIELPITRDWFTYKPKILVSVPVNNLYKWVTTHNNVHYTVWTSGLASWNMLDLYWTGCVKEFHSLEAVENYILYGVEEKQDW